MLNKDKSSLPAGRLVGFLDAGSTKNVCLIVAADKAAKRSPLGAKIVGASCLRSKGVKAGVVTNFDEAAEAVRACISEAERMAGDTLESVHTTFSCGRLRSEVFAANAEIGSGVVSADDLSRCLRGGRSYAVRDGRRLVHINGIGYRLDGQPGAHDPRGMAARRLTADLHAVTSDDAPLRNLSILAEKCYLRSGPMMIAPLASALAVTTEEERALGITVIDFGGGTLKIAMFSDGHFLHCDVMPVGADHLTFDIARMLQMPFAEAERIKALYGTLVSAQSDSHETFSYTLAGCEEGGLHQSNKAHLAEILTHRAAMIASLIAERLDRSGVQEYAGDRIVLTGGGAELVGLAEFMANRLKRSVRIAQPRSEFDLPESLAGPAYSTVVGAVAASLRPVAKSMRIESGQTPPQGYLGRVTDWLMAGL